MKARVAMSEPPAMGRGDPPATLPFRYEETGGVRYLRLEDVAAYILSLGAGEDTDV